MSVCQRRIALYVMLSLLITVGLAVVWEFPLQMVLQYLTGEPLASEPVDKKFRHLVPVIVFVLIGLSVMTILTCRIMLDFDAREKHLRQKEVEHEMFAADVAHELRTPLAVLRANLYTLDDREAALHLSQDVERVIRIVEQVLAKSRIEKLEVEAEERADLSEISASMVSFLAPMVLKEGRTIELVGADEPVVINGNAFALEQALRNLIENSIKYSARGSTITVEVSPEPAIKVIDQGRGIAQDERETIFERFHRADRRGQGSGLGLSIVRRVALAHGGNITLEDAPGGGAIFILKFS